MNRPWWALLIQWTLWAVVMLLVARWLAKSRLEPRPPSEARRLAHPRSTLIIGVVTLLLFGGMAAMKWFRLENRSGDVARISVMLVGLPEFARVLLAHVPPDLIEKDTSPVLEATAAGNPPSIWS